MPRIDTSDRPFGLPAEIVLDLPAPPSANNLFFNSVRGGRTKSKHYRAWLKEAGWSLLAQRQTPIRGPVSVSLAVEENSHRDLDGYWKPILDLLVRHRMIEDDRCEFIRELTAKWAPIHGCRVIVRVNVLTTKGRSLLTGNLKTPLAERGNDLYETPDVAVHALMRVEKLPEVIWECACGPGRIVNVLRGAGHKVYATDLVNYGCAESESGVDFLMERHPSFHVGAIVTNPPFKLAGEFATHALSLGAPKVVMLLRFAFMESVRRAAVLDGGLLARVHVFRKRLPMMHRAGWEGRKANSGMAFAWFVWELGHKGPTELHRLSW